ncbi:MAG TPA: adenylosuccinate synthetase [Candidatus Angelobacter sp.]|nr:adenylosuccinate synthetase [Candidatus Angelobacter sp.]
MAPSPSATWAKPASELLEKAFASGRRILLEGTQGTGLSLYHGSYPHVTSRDTTVAGCLSEAAIPQNRVRKIVIVCRGYPIRVESPSKATSGPMSREISWQEIGQRSGVDPQELEALEKTSTTHKKRRVGEFDWALLRRSSSINGPTDIALTFADYVSVRNTEARRFEQLTPETIRFTEEIEKVSGAPVSLEEHHRSEGLVTGVTAAELAAHYPRLYHMAEPNTWEKIKKAGLLSTSVILDECGIRGPARAALELKKRENKVPVQHPVLGEIVLRDQKPLFINKLAASLIDCSVEDWLRMLNNRVFFWLTRERLERLMSARAYSGRSHLVLTLDTLGVAQQYESTITLAPMNTGNTMPIAHPRGLNTFRRMKEYPFAERIRLGPYYTVVELAIENGARNIAQNVVRAEHAIFKEGKIHGTEILFERKM